MTVDVVIALILMPLAIVLLAAALALIGRERDR
jgi:hypothetical protein